MRLGTLDGFNFTLDDLLCSRKMFSREADTFTLGAFECGSFDGSTSGDWNDTRVSFPFRGTSRCLRPQPRWSAMLRRSLSPWDTIFDGMVLALCALQASRLYLMHECKYVSLIQKMSQTSLVERPHLALKRCFFMLISFTSTGLLHEGQMDTYQIGVYMESTAVGKRVCVYIVFLRFRTSSCLPD